MEVTGLGMVASLGLDVPSACAAARAGISRAVLLEDLSVLNEETGELVPVAGHAVRGICDGFVGVGRLLRLGTAALEDLLSGDAVQGLDWRRTAFLVALSSGYFMEPRHRQPVAGAPPAPSPVSPGEAPSPEVSEAREGLRARMLATIKGTLGGATDDKLLRLHFRDHVGVVSALEEARALLQKPEVDRCVVGGIESFLDGSVLEVLSHLGVLKTAQNANGFMPGEAAAFLLLERRDDARRRGVPALAFIEAPVQRAETVHRFSEDPPLGLALADAITQTLSGLDDQGQGTGLVFGSLNGDEWKAREWGFAQVRLPGALRSARQLHPAESFGEIGAAAGAVAVCQAARAFRGGYARSDNVLVWLSAENGAKGALYIRTGDGRG